MAINVQILDHAARINMHGRFDFQVHREFKDAYTPLLDNPVVREIEVEMSKVDYLDSSALGMLMADLRRDYVRTLFCRMEDLEMAELEAEFQKLEAEGRQALAGAGMPADPIVIERAADMRYVGQEHAVAVAMPAYTGDVSARAQIKHLFDQAHELRYSHSAPEEPADIVSLRVSAIGRLAKPNLPEIPRGETTPPAKARRGTRAVLFDGAGSLQATVYDRHALLHGNVIAGPAIIEETASTTVVEPGDRLTVNQFGHLVIEVEAAS
jgi:N-methylhydantoinase A